MFLFSATVSDNKMFLKNSLYNSLFYFSEYRSDCYLRANYSCRISSARY